MLGTENSLRELVEDKYKSLIKERLELRSLVSYVGNRKVPILRIFRYKEAFSFGLVEFLIKKLELDSDDYIFDPFAGMGTTMFSASFFNIPAIGIDKLPLAVFVAKTLPKFLSLEKEEFEQVWKSIKAGVEYAKPAYVATDVSIMKKAFREDILLLLRKIKGKIETLEEPYKSVFLLLLLSVLEECSFVSKDGQFLRIRREKKISNPLDAIERKVEQVKQDLTWLDEFYPSYRRKSYYDVYLADARDMSEVKFRKKPTAVITSPPYANRYDYTRTYSLELCFHFVENFEQLKAIRFGILRSHIESKVGKNEIPPHPIIQEVVEVLSMKKLNNPKIPSMIIGYFVDMKQVIENLYNILAPKAQVAMVVDNVRFEGEMIPVDLILSEIAEEIGFKIKEIIVARYKGNSAQQMRKYGKVPVRESILLWEKI